MTNSEQWEFACVRAGRSSGDLAHPLVYCPEMHFSEFSSAMADMKNSVAVSDKLQILQNETRHKHVELEPLCFQVVCVSICITEWNDSKPFLFFESLHEFSTFKCFSMNTHLDVELHLLFPCILTGPGERPELLRWPLYWFPLGLWLAWCVGPCWHCFSSSCGKCLRLC